MSKLTGWIDKSDSLDVQKIVENYEKELARNKSNQNSNNETKFMVGDEVWSGSLDDFESLKNEKTNSFNSKQLIRDQEKLSINKQNLINSKIEQIDDCLKNEKEKQSFEPNSKIGTFNQQINNANNEKNKTIEIDEKIDNKKSTCNLESSEQLIKTKLIKNETEKENNLDNTNDSFKTISFDQIVDNENDDQETKKIRNIKDQKILEVNQQVIESTKSLENNKINEEKNNTNSFESKTVLFDTLIEDEFKVNNQINVSQVNTKIIDDEKNNENIHNTRTIKFEQVTKEQVEEENEYIKNIPRFNLKENFEKILEESESKTIKFQTTSNNLLNNEQRFTKHLNDMIFNETVNVEDLDLTKELKDVDAIKVKEDSNKKKKSWFFSRKKKN